MLISVVICTHNPRDDYVARVLAALRAQTLAVSGWELVVVDNKSDQALVDRLDVAWHPGARIVREEVLGLTPARLLGIREAAGDLLVFVDDDNVLDPDYLETAGRIADTRSFLGSWSGQCRPGFDTPPPEWTRRYWGNLVIRQFETDVWSNLPRLPDTMPCGAGLCVRREVAHRYLELHESGQRRFQFDRTGNSLLSGGDNDLAACACDLGLGVGLVAGLKLQHLMGPERFTADYLARLTEGIYFSATLLDAEWGVPTHPRSASRRIADFLSTRRLPQPHQRIAQAAHRGRSRALAVLSALGQESRETSR